MVAATGSGPAPHADEWVNELNCVAMPGLVNAHDHMYQWATRGYVTDGTLFEWLRALYPVWARIDAGTVRVAARAAMARLMLSGCTLSTDHHYVFPHGGHGIFEALVETARELGLRFHPCRGSMSLGESQGGLPPDTVVEEDDAILAHTEHHRVRLHTHLAETLDEERFCVERFGRRPVELMEDLGWTGDDVWYAHGIHLNNAEIDRIAEVKTGIAHCPSSNMRLGAGACRVEHLVRAGARVGLGVDGSASNEDANLAMEAHLALLLARVRASSAQALDARGAWRLATRGGADCLGRDDCGSLEPGKCADIACFRVDDLAHAGIKDPLAGLALAPPARAQTVLVNGRVVVREGRLLTADEDEITRDIAAASRRLATGD
ncbi:MAG: 8-oxoguanine deaminase [Chloroflexi bacterium]|nr:MAG: 8-oxoguanine deaminase [Chloroflexota bacterium]